MTVDEFIADARQDLKIGTAQSWDHYLDQLEVTCAGRSYDSVTKTQFVRLADRVKGKALVRAAGRSGESAKESCITAARWVWREAIDNHQAAINTPMLLDKPKRDESDHRAFTTSEVLQVFDVMKTMQDPVLGVLVARLAPMPITGLPGEARAEAV